MSTLLSHEYVYKVKLPELKDVATSDFLKILQLDLDSESVARYLQEKLNNQIKEEYKNICNIKFTDLVTFYKNDISGRIHTDTPRINEEVWGINWISGGDCVMEYWTRNSIGADPYILRDSQGSLINKWNRFHANPPLRIYYMTPGAYLVNASMVHRPSAIGKRHCIVLRPKRNIPWKQAINNFNSIIVGIPTIIDHFTHKKFIEPN